MIYTFNAQDFLLYPVMKSSLELSDLDVYKTILQEFSKLEHRLQQKNISYSSLKRALVPNQDVDKFETCFVFDSSQMDVCMYGYAIFDILLPLLDKDSTYSVLCGDYINTLRDVEDSDLKLRSALGEGLVRCNRTKYHYSSQYYLIYINRLTGNQRWKIVESLLAYPWFTGFVDVTHESLFKTYISFILAHSFIKCKKRIISSHPSDYQDHENVNMLDLPFEKHGFSFSSINEESYGPFLSYKIDGSVPYEEDVGFSLNTLFPRFDSLHKLKLAVEDKKWYEYLTSLDPARKGKVLQSIGYGPDDRNKFLKDIYDKICSSYIYNLQENNHGVLMFNVCIDLPTINGNNRKTTIALKYFPESGEMWIVTVT